MDYQRYKDNLILQAEHLDDNLKIPYKPRRKINMAERGFHEEDFFDFGYVDGGGDEYCEPEEANNFDHEDYAAYATTLVHSTELKKTGFIEKEVWAKLPEDARKVLIRAQQEGKSVDDKKYLHQYDLSRSRSQPWQSGRQ